MAAGALADLLQACDNVGLWTGLGRPGARREVREDRTSCAFVLCIREKRRGRVIAQSELQKGETLDALGLRVAEALAVYGIPLT